MGTAPPLGRARVPALGGRRFAIESERQERSRIIVDRGVYHRSLGVRGEVGGGGGLQGTLLQSRQKDLQSSTDIAHACVQVSAEGTGRARVGGSLKTREQWAQDGVFVPDVARLNQLLQQFRQAVAAAVAPASGEQQSTRETESRDEVRLPAAPARTLPRMCMWGARGAQPELRCSVICWVHHCLGCIRGDVGNHMPALWGDVAFFAGAA